RRAQRVEAGGVLQREDKLAVGQLIEAGEFPLHEAAKQAGERRAGIAAEALVPRLESMHLLFAAALRPAKVVGGDLFPRPGRLGRLLSRTGRAAIERVEQTFDLGLAE